MNIFKDRASLLYTGIFFLILLLGFGLWGNHKEKIQDTDIRHSPQPNYLIVTRDFHSEPQRPFRVAQIQSVQEDVVTLRFSPVTCSNLTCAEQDMRLLKDKLSEPNAQSKVKLEPATTLSLYDFQRINIVSSLRLQTE